MEFRELYEKYRWGQVTEEEKEFVEKELVKYDSMKKYLDESEERKENEQTRIESERRKKSDKHFLKQTCLVTGIGMVVVLAVFGVIYGVKIHPAIVQANRYKAERASAQAETFAYRDWDINAKTYYSEATDAKLGYDTFYHLHMKGEAPPVFEYQGTINQGKGQYYYSITDEEGKETTGITMNGVMTTGIPKPDFLYKFQLEERIENTLSRDIEELETKKIYQVCVSFQKYLNEAGIKKLLKKNSGNDYLQWIGISTSFDNVGLPPFGIYTKYDNSNVTTTPYVSNSEYVEYSGMLSVVAEDDHIKYFLNGNDFFLYKIDPLDSTYYPKPLSMDTLKSYLNDRLDFMIDHPEVVNLLGQSELTEQKYYETVKQELEQNEYQSYGITILGTKSEIKSFCKGLKGNITDSKVMFDLN